MIEAEKSVVIASGIDSVWDYVQDISRWASLFPGAQSCTLIDDSASRWTLKVGAGGMVRTVNVAVQVEQWDGPERVDFTFKLESEPVVGSGHYLAAHTGPQQTEITLAVAVEGSGQMAPMWEAMSRPLLPQLAQTFSTRLKQEIEVAAGIPPAPKLSLRARLGRWLQKVWAWLSGDKR